MTDCCKELNKINNFKDYNILQNVAEPGAVKIRRNIMTRHVRITNNTRGMILIGIGLSTEQTAPEPKLYLGPHEHKDLALNSPGDPFQYMWVFDNNKKILNRPVPLYHHINAYVINPGLNKISVIEFGFVSYNPSH
jgi:hypothetical protein